MKKIAKRVTFTGRVQGVGFRYSCLRSSQGFSVSGYVKNLPSGAVELFAQGNDFEVNSLIEDISDYFKSYIREKKVITLPYSPLYHDFRIAY